MKKNAAHRGDGGGAEMVKQLGKLYGHSTTPEPNVYPALCSNCGTTWSRPADRPWATLCRECWKWSRVRRHVQAARKLVGVSS